MDEKWERRDRKKRKRQKVHGRSLSSIIQAIVKRAKKVREKHEVQRG